jgi:hypothetical protein
MTKQCVFITGHQIGLDKLTGTYTSSGASARLRVILPAFELKKHDIEVVVHSVNGGRTEHVASSLDTIRPDIVLVSKIFDNKALSTLKSAKSRGTRLIMDFCDNYLDGGEYQSLTLELVDLADVIVVNTTIMEEVFNHHKIRRPIVVIEDCVESNREKPRVFSKSYRHLNLLSFGSKFVCKEMEPQLPYLAEYSKKIRLYLEIVTTLDDETYRWTIAMQKKYNTENYRVSITMWHEGILKQIFSRSDLVLLPSSSSAFNLTKSPNRCMQSLWEGLPVVAYPLPSYLPFGDFCVLSERLSSGIEIAMETTNWFNKIEQAQNYIDRFHSPRIIGEKWAKLINNLVEFAVV